MLCDRSISITDIRDGTSNTLIVAEDSDFTDGQWINGLNVFDQAFAINQAPSYENDIRSKHPGGGQRGVSATVRSIFSQKAWTSKFSLQSALGPAGR